MIQYRDIIQNFRRIIVEKLHYFRCSINERKVMNPTVKESKVVNIEFSRWRGKQFRRTAINLTKCITVVVPIRTLVVGTDCTDTAETMQCTAHITVLRENQMIRSRSDFVP